LIYVHLIVDGTPDVFCNLGGPYGMSDGLVAITTQPLPWDIASRLQLHQASGLGPNAAIVCSVPRVGEGREGHDASKLLLRLRARVEDVHLRLSIDSHQMIKLPTCDDQNVIDTIPCRDRRYDIGHYR
jgi:hypothetical protein